MSIKLNVISGRKEELANVIKSIAEFMRGTPNERVTVHLSVEFEVSS